MLTWSEDAKIPLHKAYDDPYANRIRAVVIGIRVGLTALVALPFFAQLQHIQVAFSGDTEILGAMIFLIFWMLYGLPSMFIVYGITRTRRWASWLALVHDICVIPLIAVLFIQLMMMADNENYFGVGQVFGMLFGLYALVEALLLCAAMRMRMYLRYVLAALYVLCFGSGLGLLWLAHRH